MAYLCFDPINASAAARTAPSRTKTHTHHLARARTRMRAPSGPRRRRDACSRHAENRETRLDDQVLGRDLVSVRVEGY